MNIKGAALIKQAFKKGRECQVLQKAFGIAGKWPHDTIFLVYGYYLLSKHKTAIPNNTSS